MRPINSKSNEKFDTFQSDPIEASKKTRKPRRPADRGSAVPQMKSISTSNNPHVSSFREDARKSSATSAEQVQPDQNLESTKIIKHDEKFVALKLQEIDMHQGLDNQKLKAIENQLYQLALSANEGGSQWTEIQNTLSIVNILLKDGVDCSKEQARIISRWLLQRGVQRGDQKSLELFLRDKKSVALKLQEIDMHQDLDNQKLKAIENQLYEMALSANDGDIKLIVEFVMQHSERGRFFSYLGYRAIYEGNAGLFASIKAHAPNALFSDGIPAVLTVLTKPGATDSEIQNALSIIKILLKDGVDCSKEQARILARWALQGGDQKALELFCEIKN